MSCPVKLGDSSYSLADSVWSNSIITETPPSHTNLTWYVNPCGSLAGDCPEGSLICGVQTVDVEGKSIVTEVIPIARSGTDRQVRELAENAEGVRLGYSGEKWGDVLVSADISFICRQEERIALSEWSGSTLRMEIESPVACKGSKAPNSPSKEGGGWGFFSILFFLICLAFFAFIGIAVAQNRRINDVGALGEIISELPYLIKEMVAKVVGSFTSQRGGYSAL